MQTKVLQVRGMSCQHCKDVVEGALRDVPGVAAALADVQSGQVRVDLFRDVADEALVAAVEEAGYEAER